MNGRIRSSLAALIAIGTVAIMLVVASGASAQTPPAVPPGAPKPIATPTDAQALAVEHQLLCPLCVNERLDVCTLAICDDMKQIVRDRLGQGASSEEIIGFFETRYGPKVRAELPRKGFNLLLFGWVGGALVMMAVAAALALRSMRRSTRQRALATAAPADPALDALIEAAAREESAIEDPGPR